MNDEILLESHFSGTGFYMRTSKKDLLVAPSSDQTLYFRVGVSAEALGDDRGVSLTSEDLKSFEQSEINIQNESLECFAPSRHGYLPTYQEGFKLQLVAGEADALRRAIPKLFKACEIADDLIKTAESQGYATPEHKKDYVMKIALCHVGNDVSFELACAVCYDHAYHLIKDSNPELVAALKKAYAHITAADPAIVENNS